MSIGSASTRRAQDADTLPSWRDGGPKQQILDFVARVTLEGSAGFVAEEERIATFDNDGTLWSEQPLYNQLAFAIDRVRELAPAHPDWRTQQPFQGILEGDLDAIAAAGERGIANLMIATHVGNTSEEFEKTVTAWISRARHPDRGRLYTQLIYEPMRELLRYLEANAFRVFIVSGGGVEFMRPWVERVYGVPRERVIGSRARMSYEVRDGMPVLARLPEIDLFDEGPGKPVGIQQAIGRRPLAAFGNSDGDFQMLAWTTSAPGPRLGCLVHHTDAVREWAYDRNSHVGRLARGLDEAASRGWLTIDMKRDWRRIFPFESADR